MQANTETHTHSETTYTDTFVVQNIKTEKWDSWTKQALIDLRYIYVHLVHIVHVLYIIMFVRPKTSTLYVLANAFYQLIYVYSYHLCALTAVRLHNKFIPLIPFKCVAVYEQKCQLECMHLWFLIWFICIINWQSVFFSAQALPICVCPYVCVFLYRKCLLFILGIASRMCLWTEIANHMFRWLHFVNCFIYAFVA